MRTGTTPAMYSEYLLKLKTTAWEGANRKVQMTNFKLSSKQECESETS